MLNALHQSKRKLKSSEKRYRTIFENTGIAMVVIKGIIVSLVNTEAEKLIGYKKEEIEGKTWTRFVLKEDLKKLMKYYRLWKEQKDQKLIPSTHEIRLVDREGKIKHVIANLAITPGESIVSILDATDHIKVGKALTKSEERLKLALDSSNEGLWDWDIQTGKAYFSPFYYKMLGYEPGEFDPSFETYKELLHPEDKEQIIKKILKSIEQKKKDYKIEFRMRRKNGDYSWILTRGRVFEWTDDGNPKRMVGTHVDITKRKQVEKKLKEREERLSLITDNMVDIIGQIDISNGTILYISPSVKNVLGYEPENIINKRIFDFIDLFHPKDWKEVVFNSTQKAIGDLKTGKVRFRCKHADGHYMYLEGVANLIYDEKNQAKGVIFRASDISEQKRMEDALIESEEKLREVFNNANDMITLVELDENGLPGHFIEVNDVATERLGYARDEFLKMTPADIVSNDMVDKIPENAKKMLKERRATFETIHESKDGSKIPVEINTHMFKLNGKQVILAIVRDISERKKAEKVMKKSLEEKELLLKEIHHRIKNNMQVISSLLGLQSQYIKDKKINRILKESRERVKSMAMIHEKLYSSEDLARINFEWYIKDLALSLFNSYNVNPNQIKLNVKAENAFLGIDVAIPCGLILNELITNSIKYAFPDGKKGEIYIDFRLDDEGLGLIISDNGIGLPENISPVDAKTLGLLIVKTLVNQLDGTIKLDREKGTTFKINFPIK